LRAIAAAFAAILAAAPVAATPCAALAEATRAPVRIENPPPGKAIVVFYRTWLYPASAISYTVREGKQELGRLSPGTYFFITVEPGLHTYTTRAEKHDDMQIEVEADEIYYVRFELGTGWLLYQPGLTPAEQRTFDEVSAKLRRTEPLAPAEAPPPASASPAPPPSSAPAPTAGS
jgi:hypothetical protein